MAWLWEKFWLERVIKSAADDVEEEEVESTKYKQIQRHAYM